MNEIKFYGRGGQGVVVASQILGLSFFKAGMYPQCYSVFGGERRGAPVASFLRVDKQKILLKCEIKHPSEIICFDDAMFDPAEVKSLLKPGGRILINTARGPDAFADLSAYRVGLIDGPALARQAGLGRIYNTAVLVAYCALNPDLGIASVLEAVKEVAPAHPEANVKAARLAFEQVQIIDSRGSHG